MTEPSRTIVADGPRALEAALFAELEREAPGSLDAIAARPGRVRVVVPSGSLRVHLLAEMARRRRAWVGVEVVTLRRIALEIFERAGLPPPRGGALLPVLVRRAAQDEGALASLRDLEGGFAPLVGTVRDLLDAGLEAAHRPAIAELLRAPGVRVALADRPRAEAVVRVAARVARELEACGAVAGSGLFRVAANVLGADPSVRPPDRVIFVYGFADVTGSALDLLERLLHATPGTLFLDRPRSASGGERPADEPFGAPLRERLGFVGTSHVGEPAPPPRLEAFSAAGETAEAREIAGRIRAELAADPNRAPETIGVVLRDLASALPPLRRAFEAAPLPFSVAGAGRPAPVRRGAGTFVRLLDRGGRLDADGVLDLVGRSPARAHELRVALRVLGVTTLEAVAALDPATQSDVPLPVRRVRIDGEGLDRAVRRIVHREVLVRFVESARRLQEALAAIPAQAPAARAVAAVRRLLREMAPGATREWLDGALTRLSADVPEEVPLRRDELAEMLARDADAAELPPPGGAGAGIQVLSVTAARGRTFSSLYLAGLNRGRFPRSSIEDPFLPDAVRFELRTLLPDLAVQSHGRFEERFLFDQLLASADLVVLSFPSRGDDASDRLVSPLLDRLSWRDASTRALRDSWKEPVLRPATTPIGSSSPLAAALDAGLAGDRRRWARQLPAALAEARGGPAVGDEDRRLARARHAALDEIDPEPSSNAWRHPGPFLGRIGRDARRAEGLWITGVESMLACAWRTFLGARLGLEPLPDVAEVLPSPLDPRLIGTGVHRLLERSIRARLADGPRDLAEALARGATPVEFPSSAELARLAREIAADLLAEEGISHWGFEAMFAAALAERAGVAREDWGDGVRHVAGVELEGGADLGTPEAPLRVRFRADRVDLVDGRVDLLDYKTWRPSRLEDLAKPGGLHAAIAAGSHLQPAIYVAGAGGRPARGRLLALGPDDVGASRSREVTLDDGASAELAALRSVARIAAAASVEGRFLPRLVDETGDERGRACAWCELVEACLQEDSGARRRLARWAEDRRARGGREVLGAADAAEAALFRVGEEPGEP